MTIFSSGFDSKWTSPASAASITMEIPFDARTHQLHVDFFDSSGNKAGVYCKLDVYSRVAGASARDHVGELVWDTAIRQTFVVLENLRTDEFIFVPDLPASYTYQVYWAKLN